MKKITLLLLCCLLVLCLVTQSQAAGTVTQTSTNVSKDVTQLTYTWTADASDGSVPATSSEQSYDGYVVLVVTDPGSTAPTDNYDITLTDGDGVDIMGGTLANRDTANTEQAVPKIDAVYGARWVSGAITLTITNNSVNSATGEVKIWIVR